MNQELKAAQLAVCEASSALRLTALASRGLLASATAPDEARASLQALKDKYQAAVKRCEALAKK